LLVDENKYEESKIISLLADDSEYAFQLIYDRYRNRIYKLAIQYLKSPVLAQEVVQDVFLKLWFERRNLKPGSPIEAWIFTVAKNNLLNKLKKVANEWKAVQNWKVTQSFIDNNLMEKMELDQCRQIIKAAIAGLPEQQRKVYQLVRQQNLSYLETAQLLNISPLTVKTHLSRALESLKNFILKHGELFLLPLLFKIYF
jgi:RNA polymerase sigma-70 factor (family 1)